MKILVMQLSRNHSNIKSVPEIKQTLVIMNLGPLNQLSGFATKRLRNGETTLLNHI